jgi:ABC-type antimicrobial peptide transport system permease subunit
MMPDQKLVDAFYEAALWLKDRVEHNHWPVFSANFLREYVRCRYGHRFTNTLSPYIMIEVINQHPELGRWIKTKVKEGARIYIGKGAVDAHDLH